MPILKYTEDDGLEVEPETYYPVIPMLLVNGCVGIGTGFSTDIPPHNPEDLVRLLRDRLEGREHSLVGKQLTPWWFGFKGTVSRVDSQTYNTRGLYTLNDDKCSVTITELPVGTWTKDYKAFLDELCSEELNGKPFLKSFDDLYNDLDIKFVLYLEADYYEDVKADPEEFVKKFKLVSSWKLTNMNCFDADLKITKYSCAGDILEAYYAPRLVAYEKRRLTEMERLERHMLECDAKARFLRLVLDGTIDLRRKEDTEIVDIMKSHSLPALSKPDVNDVDAYDYLLRLRIDRVKAAAIKEVEQTLIASRIAYETLRDTNASALWLEDLKEFDASWHTMKAHREQVLAGAAVGATAAKKRKYKVGTV